MGCRDQGRRERRGTPAGGGAVEGYYVKYRERRADLVVSSVTNISVVVNDDFSMADLSLSLPGHVEVSEFSVFRPPGSAQVSA